MLYLGCSDGDSAVERSARNRERLEVIASAEFEVLKEAYDAGQLGPREVMVARMRESALSVSAGDTVGVEPFQFFTPEGDLIPYASMSDRQKGAYNHWLASVPTGAVQAKIEEAGAKAEAQWKEQQGE